MFHQTCLFVVLMLGALPWQADSFLFSTGIKRDCIVSPWSDWKDCRGTNGNFKESRQRYISQAQNGGKPCAKNLKSIETRNCKSSAVTTNLMMAAVGQLAFPLRSNFLPKAQATANTVKNSRNEHCNVIRDGAGNVIASGKCRKGKAKRDVDFPVSLFGRFRRQTLEKFRDVLFLIDKSGSIGSNNIQKSRDFAAALVHVFCGNIQLGNTRVAVSTFNHQYQPNLIPFDRYIDSNLKNQLVQDIRNLKFSSGGGTHIGDAMKKARLQTLKDTTHGARDDSRVEKMIVLISDGCSNGGISTSDEALALKNDGVQVLVVYVGTNKICKDKILVFDAGTLCYNRFFFNTWNDLVATSNALMNINSCQLPTWKTLETQC